MSHKTYYANVYKTSKGKFIMYMDTFDTEKEAKNEVDTLAPSSLLHTYIKTIKLDIEE